MTTRMLYSAAHDGSPYDMAVRFHVTLRALLDANNYQGDEMSWRTAFADGQAVFVPDGPMRGLNYYRYDFAAAPRALAAIAADNAIPGCPAWNRGRMSAADLWNVVANWEFRRWQLTHGGSAEQPVGTANGVASPPLWLPYPTDGAAHVVAVGPAAPGRDAPAAATVSPADDALRAPFFSAYDALPRELRETMVRSFQARAAGLPRADDNLPAVFDFGSAHPATLWEGLFRIADTDLNSIVRVYERIVALRGAARAPAPEEVHSSDAPGMDPMDDLTSTLRVAYEFELAALEHTPSPDMWRHVEYIRHAWFGSSFGFKVVYRDRPAAESDLYRNRRLARDETYGAAEHQSRPVRQVIPLFSDADTHCWREVPARAGSAGLHFCVATSDRTHDNIHIDWMDPCQARDYSGRASYALGVSVSHLYQVWFDGNLPQSPFVQFDELFRGRADAYLRYTDAQLPNSPSDEGTDLPLMVAANQAYRSQEVRDGLTIWDHASRVAIRRRRWACQGQAGWDSMLAAYRTLRQLIEY